MCANWQLHPDLDLRKRHVLCRSWSSAQLADVLSVGDGSGEREREPRIKKDKGLALPQKKIITTAYT